MGERRGSESGRRRSVIADFEDGGGGRKPSTAGGLEMLEKTRRLMVPWRLQKERRTSHPKGSQSLERHSARGHLLARESRAVQASTPGVQEKTQDGGPSHPPGLTDRRPGIHLSSRSWVHLLVQPATVSPWTPQPLHSPTCPAPLCSSHAAGLALEHRGAADNPSKAGRQVRPSRHGLLLQHRLGPPSPSCYEPAPRAESYWSPPRPAWTPRFSVHSRVVLPSPVSA